MVTRSRDAKSRLRAHYSKTIGPEVPPLDPFKLPSKAVICLRKCGKIGRALDAIGAVLLQLGEDDRRGGPETGRLRSKKSRELISVASTSKLVVSFVVLVALRAMPALSAELIRHGDLHKEKGRRFVRRPEEGSLVSPESLSSRG